MQYRQIRFATILQYLADLYVVKIFISRNFLLGKLFIKNK